MFILLEDWSKEPDADEADKVASMIAAHRQYFAYVEDNRARFPQKAYELAASAWRQNFKLGAFFLYIGGRLRVCSSRTRFAVGSIKACLQGQTGRVGHIGRCQMIWSFA